MTDGLKDTLQRTLGSAYVLDRELGGGGMSRVFLARETALDRTVVIKVLPPELAAGVNIDRFRREIVLAARLQHPHIVPLLTAGETDGLPYFTMPFIEGESLRVTIDRSGELPIQTADPVPPRSGVRVGVRAGQWGRASRHQAGQHPDFRRRGHGHGFRRRQSTERCGHAQPPPDS